MFQIQDGTARGRARRNGARLEDRATSELIGICRGVLADGVVCEQEAAFLLGWIERHEALADEYPFSLLYGRLAAALQDGVLDADEEADLLDSMVGLVGGERRIEGEVGASLASSLPLCRPAPDVDHRGRIFVVTGTFEFGARADVVNAIAAMGGRVHGNVVQSVNYLVIGAAASRDWAHSSYGRKIEKAVEYRAGGVPIAIISEAHWRGFL